MVYFMKSNKMVLFQSQNIKIIETEGLNENNSSIRHEIEDSIAESNILADKFIQAMIDSAKKTCKIYYRIFKYH